MSSFSAGFKEDNQPVKGLRFKTEPKLNKRLYNPLSPTDLPPAFQPLLRDFSWAEYFVLSQKLKQAHAEIEAEIEAIKALPASADDVLTRIRAEYDANEENRRRLIRNLAAGVASGKPIIGNELLEELTQATLPSWQELEAAIRELIPGGIAEVERQRQLNELAAQHDYRKCHPQSRYTVSRRKVEASAPQGGRGITYQNEETRYDHWQAFIEEWRKIQSNRCEPCDILGFHLDDADEETKEAWRILRLERQVNEEAVYLPARGNARERFAPFFQV